MKRGTF